MMFFRLAVLVSSAVALAAAALPGFKEDSCELENGFKYEECGTVSNAKVCCSPEEQCVSAKPWEGDEQFVCSTERQLSGSKVFKIVLLPVVLAITFLGVAGFLIKKFPKDLTTGLCIKQVILSVFLLFSPAWPLALYTVIINFFVASGVTTRGLAWWVYRLLFLLQIFHITAVFGPFETFHVPLGDLSTFTDSKVVESFSTSEAKCSTYYGGYFTLLPIELTIKDVNPNQKTFGYCLEEWLTTVQFFCAIVGVLQSIIAFRTGQPLLGTTLTTGKKDEAVVEEYAARPETTI